MKKFLSLSILILIVQALLGQSVFSPLKPEWERDNQGNSEFIFTNNDYCDYYVVWTNSNRQSIRPGKNVMMRITANNSSYYKTTFPDGYRYFKGEFISKFNPNAIYALPLRNGDTTSFTIDTKQRELTFKFKVKGNDTIFACRAGIVCLDETMDYSSKYYNPKKGNAVLIYHPDNTFAEYKNFSDIFVSPGEQIKVGQAIGKAKNYLNEPNLRSLSISFFYLDQNKFSTMDNSKKHSHFTPVFQTKEKGIIKLEEKVSYTSYLSDSVMTQDMSSREIKKYYKKKLK